MKKFLTICIIAMTSAGIYGFIDMSREIHNGTMITYEDVSAPMVKAHLHARTQAQAVNNSIEEKLAVIAANKKKEEEEKKKLELTNMKIEDFSRGEGIYIPPTETDLTIEGTDAPSTSTTVTADTVKTSPPPSTSQMKKTVSDSSSLVSVDEPSLNERMFSRGSPRYYKKSLAKK